MLLENCFVCCKPLPDKLTCNGDNANTIHSLKSVLDIVGISYASFVGDLHEVEDCENFNDACSLCARCCNLINIAEDLRKSLLVIKQKFVDRVAAGHQRRRSTKNDHLLPKTKVIDQVSDRLGQCFTRSTVAIRPEDEIPLEKLKSLEPTVIAELKQEILEVDFFDDSVDPFFNGSEPEADNQAEASPPIKRRKGRPLKSAPSGNLLRCKDRGKSLPSMEQPAVAIHSRPSATPEESADLHSNMEDDNRFRKRRRQTRMSNRKQNEALESSSETDVSLQNSSSSENSDSWSSECEGEVIGNLTETQRRSLMTARYRKSDNIRFRCGKCPNTWAVMSALDRHVKNEHEALSLLDRPYGCAVCPTMFHTYEDLKNHVIHYTIAKGHEDCLLCDFSDNLPVLTGHYFKEHGLDFLKGKYFGCVQCLQAFEPTGENTRSGFVSADDVPAFKSFTEEHRSCISPKELIVPQKCRICPETRLTAAEVISHEVTHFPSMYCTLCDFDFKTESALKDHNNIFHRKFAGFKPREVRPHLPNLSSLRTSRCKVCGRWFSNEKKMTAHAITHAAEEKDEKKKGSSLKLDRTTLEYNCTICEEAFTSIITKRRHMTWIQNLRLFRKSGDTFYSCFACLALFEPSDPIEIPGRLLPIDKEKFLKFAAEHAVCNREPVSEFSCTQCHERFTEPKHLFKHMLALGSHSQQDVKKHPCRHCESDFDSNIEYLFHLRQQHVGKIKLKCQCYQCGKQFQDMATLQAHVLENSKQLQCTACDQNFNRLESYQKHTCKSDQIPAPKEVTSAEVPAHCFQLNGGFPCLPCEKTFDSVALLSLHFQEHHDKAEEINFNCSICSTTLKGSETRKNGEETFYSTNDDMKHADFTLLCAKHWKTCIANQDTTSCSETVEPLFQCYVCHKIQDSPQSLASHLNEHHRVSEVHRCQACSSIFNKKRSFGTHLKIHHNLQSYDSDQYYCRSCWEPFRSTDPEMKLGAVAEKDMLQFHAFLDQHFQCKSDKIKPKCSHCSREFGQVPHLLLHDVSIHSRKHIKHYCERCGNGYADVDKLKRHFEIHEIEEGKREKPTCQICGKTFTHSRYLKRHLLICHSHDTPFVCQFCGKGFGIKPHLLRHEGLHFSVKPSKTSSLNRSPTLYTVPCPICGKLFMNLRYMKYHVTWTHNKCQRKNKRKSAKERREDQII